MRLPHRQPRAVYAVYDADEALGTEAGPPDMRETAEHAAPARSGRPASRGPRLALALALGAVSLCILCVVAVAFMQKQGQRGAVRRAPTSAAAQAARQLRRSPIVAPALVRRREMVRRGGGRVIVRRRPIRLARPAARVGAGAGADASAGPGPGPGPGPVRGPGSMGRVSLPPRPVPIHAVGTLGVSAPAQPTAISTPYPVDAQQPCVCEQADLEFGFER